MVKIFLKWFILVSVAFVIQSSFLPIIHYNGVGPDLLLLIVGSFAFFSGSRLGCYMGFLVGLFQDLATGNFLGMNAFSKMLIGYWCGIFSSRVLRDSFILPVAAAIVSTAASYCIAGVIVFVLGYRFNPLVHITTHLLPMLCYNLVFAYPMHAIVHKLIDDPESNNKRGIV